MKRLGALLGALVCLLVAAAAAGSQLPPAERNATELRMVFVGKPGRRGGKASTLPAPTRGRPAVDHVFVRRALPSPPISARQLSNRRNLP